MELRIDQRMKKQYQKNISKSINSVRVTKLIAEILLLIGVLGGLIYIVVNFVSPSLSVVNVNGVYRKDIGWIIISTSFIIVPCFILSLALNTLSKNLAGGSNSARVDESILITKEKIKYYYRQKHQSLSSERRVLTLEFCKIDTISFDDKTKLLNFSGEILSEYYDDYKKNKPIDIKMLEEFVICDYFFPSLKDTLQSMGIVVNELEV